MNSADHVEYFTEGMVAVIRFNRPKAMNALNSQTRREFAVAQNRAEVDENVRVVIVTGSGKSFSSGTCLQEASAAADRDGDNFEISITEYKPLVDAITQSKKIYIAAINGYAGGVALNFAMGADLAIMGEDSVVSSPFANVGLIPDGGACWYMHNTLGYKRAFAAIAECTLINASDCLDLGLVNKVVPNEDLFEAAMKWGQDLAERAPLSLRFAKEILRAVPTLSQQETARMESEYQNKCLRSEDSKNAMKSFLNKETPVFAGK